MNMKTQTEPDVALKAPSTEVDEENLPSIEEFPAHLQEPTAAINAENTGNEQVETITTEAVKCGTGNLAENTTNEQVDTIMAETVKCGTGHLAENPKAKCQQVSNLTTTEGKVNNEEETEKMEVIRTDGCSTGDSQRDDDIESEAAAVKECETVDEKKGSTGGGSGNTLPAGQVEEQQSSNSTTN